MTALRLLDRVSYPVPLGLLVRSASERHKIGEGLVIRATNRINPTRSFQLTSTPSGHWAAHILSGIDAETAANPAVWAARAKPYRFHISDRLGRYLPMRFDAPLPKRGSLIWPGWAGVNRQRIAPLLPPGSGASFIPDYVPLFPAVASTGSKASARIMAHLAVREVGGATRDAAWAMMTISFGSTVVGLGLADARGAIAVGFGYPPMPSQTPAAAVLGREAVTWPVRARIYFSELGDAQNPDAPPPDFADIIGQLATPPRVAMATIMGAQPALGDQTLTLGEPLVLRSRLSGNQFASSLFLKPA